MDKPQIIYVDDKPAFAVVPWAEWERAAVLLAAQEDADDLALYQAAQAQGGETFPAELVNRILDGANPIKAFREYRGLTQRELATAAGVNPVYLSQLENGRRVGSVETLRALARALRADMDLLTTGAS